MEILKIPEKYWKQVHKIFLADGDAAIYPTEGLIKILEQINESSPNLNRVSAYADPHAILSKNEEEWSQLRKLNLKLLYFGLESGNRVVLDLMNKGMDPLEMQTAIQKLRGLGIKF